MRKIHEKSIILGIGIGMIITSIAGLVYSSSKDKRTQTENLSKEEIIRLAKSYGMVEPVRLIEDDSAASTQNIEKSSDNTTSQSTSDMESSSPTQQQPAENSPSQQNGDESSSTQQTAENSLTQQKAAGNGSTQQKTAENGSTQQKTVKKSSSQQKSTKKSSTQQKAAGNSSGQQSTGSSQTQSKTSESSTKDSTQATQDPKTSVTSDGSRNIVVEIKKGYNTAEVAQVLFDKGVISNKDDFVKYMILQSATKKIIADKYNFKKNEDFDYIIKTICYKK